MQFVHLLSTIVLVLTLGITSPVAAEGLHSGTALVVGAAATGAFTKAEEKQARDNDVASKYILKENGDLFRMVRGAKCQVTTKVKDFKISMHPTDSAVIYYTREEGTDFAGRPILNLYVLHNAGRTGDCPPASKKKIMDNVKKFTVTSNTNTTIVNAASSKSGQFAAWDDTRALINLNGIKDFQMHQNFGVSGKPFSSYVLFALTDEGYIIKVKGNDVQNSKPDLSRKYKSISEFKEVNRID